MMPWISILFLWFSWLNKHRKKKEILNKTGKASKVCSHFYTSNKHKVFRNTSSFNKQISNHVCAFVMEEKEGEKFVVFRLCKYRKLVKTFNWFVKISSRIISDNKLWMFLELQNRFDYRIWLQTFPFFQPQSYQQVSQLLCHGDVGRQLVLITILVPW